MHLTPEQKQEIVKEVVRVLGETLERSPFWVGVKADLMASVNNAGPERLTTPTSGNT